MSASSSPQTPGYKGIIIISSTLFIPVLAEPSLVAPEGDITPPIIGNWYEGPNFAPGLVEPRVNFQFAPRDTPNEIFSATFLDFFFARNNTIDHDTAVIPGGIVFWNGRSGFQLNGVKGDSLSINMSKTGGLRVAGSFCASNKEGTDALVPLTGAPAFTPWDTTPLLYGQNLGFEGALANEVWSADINVANNHRANNVMNKSRYPADQNASMKTFGMQITMRAAATPPANFTQVQAGIYGTGWTCLFNMLRPKWQTPNNTTISLPESFKQYAAKVLAAAGQSPGLTYTLS